MVIWYSRIQHLFYWQDVSSIKIPFCKRVIVSVAKYPQSGFFYKFISDENILYWSNNDMQFIKSDFLKRINIKGKDYFWRRFCTNIKYKNKHIYLCISRLLIMLIWFWGGCFETNRKNTMTFIKNLCTWLLWYTYPDAITCKQFSRNVTNNILCPTCMSFTELRNTQ